MNSTTIKSHAKVNIGLQVLNRRPDGYHHLHTIFQELDFHDTLTLTGKKEGCSLSSNHQTFPLDESNTCHQAYYILKRNYPHIGGINIQVDKQIPAGGGLGGGSSNGAAVLKGLNQIYRLSLSEDDLENLAVEVGADVPFSSVVGASWERGLVKD